MDAYTIENGGKRNVVNTENARNLINTKKLMFTSKNFFQHV